MRRRRLGAAGAVVLVAALVGAVGQVRERRAFEAEERRIARVVSLSGTSEGIGAAWSRAPAWCGSAAPFGSRTPGSDRVTVVDGSAGDFAAENDVALAQGARGVLVLALSRACPTERPPDPTGEDVLSLDVRTEAGVRPYELLVPSWSGDLWQPKW